MSFSIDLWKKAFKDASERLCPVRAGGHQCGCLPMLPKLVSMTIDFGFDGKYINPDLWVLVLIR